MKKVVLTAVACAIISPAADAEVITLYSDPKTGQVFTTRGEGRVMLGDFIDAKSVDTANRERESRLTEYQKNQDKYVKVKSHAKTIEFSGLHYFGLSSNGYGDRNYNGGDQSAGFELRRNYLQAKAYFNDRDFFRITLDSTKELESTTTYSAMNVKYAYLYLDRILPYTGVEIGIAHRPWIDYEEHNGWMYRSINKVILEDKFSTVQTGAATTTSVGPDVLNSADLGINIKTNTPYVSSEIGIFNGEGYHADKLANNQQNSSDLSFEWRLTGHLFGNGDKKLNIHENTYANVSFAGLSSNNHKDNNVTINDAAQYNRNAYWFHFVYNQPEFLIAAQYDVSKDKKQNGSGETKLKMWSVNAEIRPIKDWTVLARYDDLTTEYSADATKNSAQVGDANQFIYGLAYEYGKNIKFIASGKTVDAKETTAATGGYTGATATTVGNMLDKQSWMVTTEVEW